MQLLQPTATGTVLGILAQCKVSRGSSVSPLFKLVLCPHDPPRSPSRSLLLWCVEVQHVGCGRMARRRQSP
eukprot:2220-Eustigmatos_ZCMA.PRE.1